MGPFKLIDRLFKKTALKAVFFVIPITQNMYFVKIGFIYSYKAGWIEDEFN